MADCGNDRASLFCVDDGGLVGHIATGLATPADVEQVEGGWLVACCGSNTVEFVAGRVHGGGGGGGGCGDGARPSLGGAGEGPGDYNICLPAALARVPGLGLVVRELGFWCRQVFAIPDEVLMATMSPLRVGWMVGVVKGGLRCATMLERC